MDKQDVVYILANNCPAEELRYSIRSVVENFPHDRIVFYGGKPEGIEPDKYVEVQQQGADRYDKVVSTIKLVCQDADISDDFWLFNDDFFVMDKVEDLPHLYQGSIQDRIDLLAGRWGKFGHYIRAQIHVKSYLERNGYSTLDYALHMPMLINKSKALEVLEAHPYTKMFRTVYGNVCALGGEQIPDCKIYDRTIEPDHSSLFLSTTDRSFKGNVGKYIMKQFPFKSDYEVAE